jgi:hypothetical protein
VIEFTPIEPALFDEPEAAAYLRLAHDGEDAEAARRALNRLVDQGKIRPCLVGGRRRYSRRELDRFIDQETEKYESKA